jgi:hypothetical protein
LVPRTLKKPMAISITHTKISYMTWSFVSLTVGDAT